MGSGRHMTQRTGSSPTGWIEEELDRLRSSALERSPYLVESRRGAEVVVGGRKLVLAASNDYLGLATDERVREAAAQAALRWGSGSGASPLVSGYAALQEELEERLAEFKGYEACVVFSSGYLANVGTVASLVGKGDAVFSDALNHASIIDGCRLSGAQVRVFHHRDLDHLEDLVGQGGFRRGLVVTDGVFSMDGDLADLGGIVAVAERYGLMTMVDEAHATGVVGPGGRGSVAWAGLEGKVDVVMGTLSKALGSAGGFVCGSRHLVSFLRNKARTFIFDTAPAPAALGAALCALGIARDEGWRRQRIEEAKGRLLGALEECGVEMPELAAAIVPLQIGEAAAALEAARLLVEMGVFAPAIRPPSVPEGTSRIRLTLSAVMGEEELDVLVRAVTEVARRFMSAAGPQVESASRSPQVSRKSERVAQQ